MSDWIDLLRDDVVRSGSINKTAQKIGVSRSSISLALSGKYPAGTKSLEAKVREALTGLIECPFHGASIPAADCVSSSHAPMPTSSPAALRMWSACQTCPQKPKTGE